MSCLLYCIRPESAPEPTPPLSGVDGQPVAMVRSQGLAAAVSRHPAPDLAPDLARLRAYAEVVARFHALGPVIPMRYGCRLGDTSRVAELLAQRASLYHGLLKELEGGVEMGVRIWLPGKAETAGYPGEAETQPAAPAAGDGPAGPPEHPGWAYLAARQALYQAQEQLTREYQLLAAGCLAHLNGLYRRHRTEEPGTREGLSLYFLVPREGVAAFRRAVRAFRPPAGSRLLLSGPWPPYNLVNSPPALIAGRQS